MALPRLRSFGFGVRSGLTGIVLTLGMGQSAGVWYMANHYEKRDERPGLSVDDLKSAYHGLNAPSPILAALGRGHPEGLKEDEREVLVKWLGNGARIDENFDNPDLGVASPKEIIAGSCVKCHSVRGEWAGKALPLDTLADVKKVAFERVVNPVPKIGIAASMHAHAPALACWALALIALGVMTRWPRRAVGFVAGMTGLALFADLGAWWVSREVEGFVYVIVGAGFLLQAGLGLLSVMVLGELWLPGGEEKKP